MLKVTHAVQEQLFDALQALGDVKASGPALVQLRRIASKIEQCLVEIDERNIGKSSRKESF